MSNYLEGLNEEQMSAVKATEGYVRVVAGAGSGKTKTLTSRIAFLIDEVGVAAKNILAVTFTNKAAKEMKKRVYNYLGVGADGAMISTFGALEVKIIREDSSVIGFPKNFKILDEEDKKTIFRNLLFQLKEEKPDLQLDPVIKVKYLVDGFNNRNSVMNGYPMSKLLVGSEADLQKEIKEATQLLNEESFNPSTVARYLFDMFVYEKKKSFALDFTDLPAVALSVLESSAVAEKWQSRLQYIMVDEYQDVSKTEIELISILQSKHHNLFVVGDGDQTIYSFRGSDVNIFLDFDKRFKPTKTIFLLKNYRSGSVILDVSNRLIGKNINRIPKDLTAERNEVGKVVYMHAPSDKDEAKFVTDNISEIHKQGVPLSDMAILYRSHSISRPFEEALLRENIPYRVFSGVGFYQRKEVKDVLAYLSLVVSDDNFAFARVVNEPRRGFGPKSLTKLQNIADTRNISLFEALKNDFDRNKHLTAFVEVIEGLRDRYTKEDLRVSDLIELIIGDTGYETLLREAGDQERLDNLAELKQSLIDEEESGEVFSAEEYLQNISLLTSQDQSESKEQVNLMTIHTAKGLEFPIVFVVGLSEGVFPSARITTSDEMEEERRLAYVAFTRAENQLILSDSEGFSYSGGTRYPSRFIGDAERVGVEYIVEVDEDLLFAYKHPGARSSFTESDEKFSIGQHVLNRVFGSGEVIGLDDKFVEVRFAEGVRTLNPNKLTLEPDQSEVMVDNLSLAADVIDLDEDKLTLVKKILKQATKTDIVRIQSIWPDLVESLSVSYQPMLNVARPVAASFDGVVIAFDFNVIRVNAERNEELLRFIAEKMQELTNSSVTPRLIFIDTDEWPTFRSSYVLDRKQGSRNEQV
jgi:DNA helicase-2/ATP-dependent DNA helicase PcrA